MNGEAVPATAVVVMARAPRPHQVRRALEPILGADGCAALQAVLIVAAVRWACEVAPGAVHVAHDPPDAAPEMRALLPADVVLLPQNGDGIGRRLADATARVFVRHHGPVLIVWPDLPRWWPEHASAALSDLHAGCDLVLGPVNGGGLYMLAIDRPQAKLFALPEQAWRGPDVISIGIAAASSAGLEVGILRTERALQRPADLRAARADPMLPAEVAKILGACAA